jgi:hypothetical protein
MCLALLSTKMGIITWSVQIWRGGESLDDYPLEAKYILFFGIITLRLVKGFVCELKITNMNWMTFVEWTNGE